MIKNFANNRNEDKSQELKISADSQQIDDKSFQLSYDGEIIRDGGHYKGASRLYDLVFIRLANDEIYTEAYFKAYKNICLQTSARKRLYDLDCQVISRDIFKI